MAGPALSALLVLLAALLPSATGYCAGLGRNPGFRTAPIVEQVTLTSVRVSWEGLVTRIECADQFIVKSWLTRNPNDYQMSDLLPLTQFSYIVRDLVPNQDYVFQAVAREDKGILGKDWNKSPKAYYRTTTTNPTVAPEPRASSDTSGGTHIKTQPGRARSVSVFMLAGLVVAGLLVLLVVVGGLWNLVNLGRGKRDGDTDSEEGDSDSLELELEHTDLESRAGSRCGTRTRRARSPLSDRTGRTWSPASSVPDINEDLEPSVLPSCPTRYHSQA